MNVIGGAGTYPSSGRVRRLRRLSHATPPPAPSARGGRTEQVKQRILVVDDDPVVRRLVSATLLDEGYDVAVARDGDEAVRKALAAPPGAIVLDLEMPGLDGRSVFRVLRERGVRAPVLLLSANGAHEARRELHAEGALEKPFDPVELLSRVEGLILPPSESGAAAAASL